MEATLNNRVETHLGNLLKFARELRTKKLPIAIDQSTKNIAWTYIKSLIARSEVLFESVMNNSVYLQFMSRQDQHDFVVDYSMLEKKQLDTRKI